MLARGRLAGLVTMIPCEPVEPDDEGDDEDVFDRLRDRAASCE